MGPVWVQCGQGVDWCGSSVDKVWIGVGLV